jgi:HD-GYP domain-containing protein (c-di-GMP phosphodiesterase class II)
MRLENKQKRVIRIGYLLTACFAILSFTPYFVKGVSYKLGLNTTDPGILYPLFILYFISYPAYAHYLAYKSFAKLSDIGKKQIKHVAIAGTFGLSAGSLIFFTVYGINIPVLGPLAFYFIAASNLFVAIATYTAHLMGVEVIKRKTLIFSLMYGGIVGSFAALIFIMQRFLSLHFNLNRWVLPVAALFIITVFIRPLEHILARATDAVLHQRGYDYMSTLKNVAKGMTLVTDTKKLLKIMVRFISKEVRIAGCSIYIYNKTLNSYVLEVSQGFRNQESVDRVDADSPFIKWLIEKKEPLNSENVLSWIQGERIFPQKLILKRTLEQIRITMQKTGASLCVPSFLRGEMIGFLALGEKLSGERYTRDDLSLLSTLSSNAAIAFENARMYEELKARIDKLDHLYKEEHTLFIDAASAFSVAIDSKDGYNNTHASKLSGYAAATTRELEKLLSYINFTKDFYETLRIASLLHDVGKIGIPDKILTKKGRLTKKERETLKQHTIIGERILNPIKEIESTFDIIRHHHENFDGTGYPDGLKGNEIPMASRIIAVCNAYDEMTSARPYRKPIKKRAALKELERGKSSQFDPVIVDAFTKASKNFSSNKT